MDFYNFFFQYDTVTAKIYVKPSTEGTPPGCSSPTLEQPENAPRVYLSERVSLYLHKKTSEIGGYLHSI